MTLFTPLGLLGLLGVVALIIIYIIKPNYQTKRISSTYIWKLSLKYRKKRIPLSKLRNILLIICQVLILLSLTAILTRPNKVLKEKTDEPEIIAVLDSSASMYAATDQVTRFERAISKIKADSEEIFNKNGYISLMVADTDPHFLIERVKADKKDDLYAALDDLLASETPCSYGVANIEKAFDRCEDIIKDNPDVKINLYTDTGYTYKPDSVNLINVSDVNEWNAGILNAYAEKEENYFVFYVEVACYGQDTEITINLEVQDANAMDSTSFGDTFIYEKVVQCSRNMTKTVVFKYFASEDDIPSFDSDTLEYYYIDTNEKVYSYQSVHLSLNVEDSFAQDNTFDIYGGQKELIKVQYASDDPSPFYTGILLTWKSAYQDRWDIQIDEVRTSVDEPKVEGYDFYIFEHFDPKDPSHKQCTGQCIPQSLPKDGIVMLVNPMLPPRDAGINWDRLVYEPGVDGTGVEMFIEEDYKEHSLMTNVKQTEKMKISKYVHVANYDSDWQVLMSVNNDPLYMIKNTEDSKMAVFNFGLNYSTLSMLKEFPFMMLNMLDYFFTPTVEKNSFEVYDKITLNARGNEITVRGGLNMEKTFYTLPAEFSTNLPGTYTLEQTTFTGKQLVDKIYIKIPASESNIWKVEDAMPEPYKVENLNDFYRDLILYIAAAWVTLMFIEWILKGREEV